MSGILKPAHAKSPELMSGIRFSNPLQDDPNSVCLFCIIVITSHPMILP